MLLEKSFWYGFLEHQQTAYGAFLLLTIFSVLVYGVYNVFFHPLSRIPGPWIYATSRIPYIWQVLNGRLAVKLDQLHQQHGPVVRTASNEVSFITSEAWGAIYGTKNSTRREFAKNYDEWNETVNKFTTTLFLAGTNDHRRMRKVLSPAFSDRVIQEHEARIQVHVSKFLDGIRLASKEFTVAVDFNDWFNWLAFDAISDFAIGESFNTLEDPRHRSWLTGLSKTWQFISIISSVKSLAPTKDGIAFALPRKLLQGYVDQLTLVGRTALARLNLFPEQPTFLSRARAERREREPGFTKQTYLSDEEVLGNTELIVTAGTDTSASALPATVELLARNPEKMARLLTELRSFSAESELTIRSIATEVPYLTACIMETMRIYPPVPEGLPRICPPAGEEICGYWIPGGTFCQISPHAANRSSQNFAEPHDFVPERWLKCDHPFATSTHSRDVKAAFRPFSFGPRDCIGQSFALTSMRLTLARLFYRYNVVCTLQDNWLDQKSYLLWKRRPMMVYLTPAGNPDSASWE